MEGVAHGDVRAFEHLVRSHWSKTALYARHLTADPEQAQDFTQEAFCRLWERRAKWVSSGSVRLWLLKTVRNLVITEYRKWKVRKQWVSQAGVSQATRPACPLENAEKGELYEAINAALGNLSPRRREAFTLFHLQGLSYQEVSKIMDVRPQTAANYVQAAIADLRVALAQFFPSARRSEEGLRVSPGRKG